MTNPISAASAAGSIQQGRAARWFAAGSLVLLGAWAAFWLWFSISVVISEKTLAWQPYTFIASVIVLAIGGWRFPRLGGIAMIASGAIAVFYFDNIWARLLLALPAMLIGGARFLAGHHKSRQLSR